MSAQRSKPASSKVMGVCSVLAMVLVYVEARSAVNGEADAQTMTKNATADTNTRVAAPAQKVPAVSDDPPSTPMKGMDMPPASPPTPPVAATPMPGMDMAKPGASGAPMGDMGTGAMQGGRAPPDARDPDDYADGYEYSEMPGLEHTDQLRFATAVVDELEFLGGNEGKGINWAAQASYGGDTNKMWLRTQGQKIPGTIADASTGVEALWWHATSAFWGSQLGLRQDLGPGAHTYIAFGTEGLAPHWFQVQLTGYVGQGGRLAGRLKASYDMRFTNRLILTPSVEANLYSQPDAARAAGAGLSTIESAVRLRYEIHRKFAPYVGFVWERSFAGTAVLRRTEDSPVNERSFVAGLRFWF